MGQSHRTKPGTVKSYNIFEIRRNFRRGEAYFTTLQKPALNKIQYKQRVKEVLRTVKAQNVAKAKFRNLKKVCKEVVKKKGAMSRQ